MRTRLPADGMARPPTMASWWAISWPPRQCGRSMNSGEVWVVVDAALRLSTVERVPSSPACDLERAAEHDLRGARDRRPAGQGLDSGFLFSRLRCPGAGNAATAAAALSVAARSLAIDPRSGQDPHACGPIARAASLSHSHERTRTHGDDRGPGSWPGSWPGHGHTAITGEVVR